MLPHTLNNAVCKSTDTRQRCFSHKETCLLELYAVIGTGEKKKPECEHLILSAVPVHSWSLNRQPRTRSTDVSFQTGINLYIQSQVNDILVLATLKSKVQAPINFSCEGTKN